MIDLQGLQDLYEPPADSNHLSDENWEHLACGELSPTERTAALDHITACQSCRQLYRALDSLAVSARAEGFDIPSSFPSKGEHRPGQTWVRWASLAATLLLTTVALMWFLGPTLSPLPETHENPVGVNLRSAADLARPQLLDPEGPYEGSPELFRWTECPGAQSYDLSLLNDQGETLWQVEGHSGTTLSPPSEVLLQPGVYFWRVEANFEDVIEKSTSILGSFSVRTQESEVKSQ